MTEKVLIVEDDLMTSKLLESILGNANFQTIIATDGIEALKKLEVHDDIKAILLDKMMPNMDGPKFLEHIKSNKEWQDIPVIMITSADGKQDILNGVTSGVYYYMTKPFDKGTVIAVLKSALNHEE